MYQRHRNPLHCGRPDETQRPTNSDGVRMVCRASHEYYTRDGRTGDTRSRRRPSDPFDGSSWQAYSEDAYLNAQLGAEAVRGIQAEGIMANTEQIGPSSSGASSGDINSQVDLQVLHEIY